MITIAEAERFARKALGEAHVTGAQIAVLQPEGIVEARKRN